MSASGTRGKRVAHRQIAEPKHVVWRLECCPAAAWVVNSPDCRRKSRCADLPWVSPAPSHEVS